MSHRGKLLLALQEYGQRHPEEESTVQRFVAFIQAHVNCFERSLRIGHVTGSAWVINRAGTHALFTHHRKLNRWLQVGGHADGDADVASVALREAHEESGLTELTLVDSHIFDLDDHLIPTREHALEHVHYDVRYLLRAELPELLQASYESHRLAWFSLNEIYGRFAEESILRMARKWARRKV